MLRGLGGMALTLPILEAMLSPNGAHADDTDTPNRFLTCYSHTSLGGGADKTPNLYAPNTTGSDYDLEGRVATLPFERIKDEVTIVSNLEIPMKKDNGGVLPRAGLGDLFHGKPIQCQFAGVGLDNPAGTSTGARETMDVMLAREIGADTAFPRLHYGVSGMGGKGSSPTYAPASMGGAPRREVPQTALRDAWLELTGAYAPTDPEAAAERLRLLDERRSILDVVHQDRDRLVSRLGRADQIRLEQHFEHIRGLELKLADLAEAGAAECGLMEDPGPDPPIVISPSSSGGSSNKHSFEDLRAQVVMDLVYMAFSCDLSRVATITFIDSGLWVEELIGVTRTTHDITHNGPDKTLRLSQLFAWMHGHQATLIERMRDTPEGTGSMLDHVVMTSWHEGGHGRGPERNTENQTHSCENMCVMIAGRAGGLMPGQHIDAQGAHPGAVHVSALRALGVGGGLGDLREDEFLGELFA